MKGRFPRLLQGFVKNDAFDLTIMQKRVQTEENHQDSSNDHGDFCQQAQISE